jgi:hypothetical protein
MNYDNKLKLINITLFGIYQLVGILLILFAIWITWLFFSIPVNNVITDINVFNKPNFMEKNLFIMGLILKCVTIGLWPLIILGINKKKYIRNTMSSIGSFPFRSPINVKKKQSKVTIFRYCIMHSFVINLYGEMCFFSALGIWEVFQLTTGSLKKEIDISLPFFAWFIFNLLFHFLLDVYATSSSRQ